MFNLFGFRKDSKKASTEKEVEGGFVIVGETVEEQKAKMGSSIAQPSTNVVVQPSKSSCPPPTQPTYPKLPVSISILGPTTGPSVVVTDAAPALPDLLGDIPFTLAPHILAMQAGFSLIPDVLLSRDINYNLSNFQYDFTLENSVLHNM